MQLFKVELRVPKDAGKSQWIDQRDGEEDGSQLVDAGDRENLQDFKRVKVMKATASASNLKVCVKAELPWPSHSAALVQSHPLDEPSPLGLILRKTPSFLELASLSLSRSRGRSNFVRSSHGTATTQENEKGRSGRFASPPFSTKDKLKAANFPATVLKIGAWERSSQYEGDVVGKCYYAKQKLVWEVLEKGLKNKIEVQWSAISAMKASFPENQPGRLEIEVSRPPLFFTETDPQPRKHTLWHATSDFTGGEATVCKWHQLWFSEGVLNKHYEKIIQCDARLRALAVVEAGSIDICNVPIKQQPKVICCELDFHRGVSNHSLSLHSVSELTEAGTFHSNASCSKVDQEKMALPVPPVLVSSPASVNNTWTAEESFTSDNEQRLFKDSMVALLNIESEERASVLSVNSVDAMPEYGVLFISGEMASSEKHLLDEITDMLTEEQSESSFEQNMVFPTKFCTMPAIFDEDKKDIPPWMPKPYSMIDGFSLAEINCNLLETFQSHVYYSLNSNTADEKPVKMELVDDASLNDLFYNALDSVKQCSSNDSGEDVLVSLPRIASLPQLFQVSKDTCHSRHENLSSLLETA